MIGCCQEHTFHSNFYHGTCLGFDGCFIGKYIDESIVVQTVTTLKLDSKESIKTPSFSLQTLVEILVSCGAIEFLFEFCFSNICFPKLGYIKDGFYNYY